MEKYFIDFYTRIFFKIFISLVNCIINKIFLTKLEKILKFRALKATSSNFVS